VVVVVVEEVVEVVELALVVDGVVVVAPVVEVAAVVTMGGTVAVVGAKPSLASVEQHEVATTRASADTTRRTEGGPSGRMIPA